MNRQETAKKPNPRRDELNRLGEAWCAPGLSPEERDNLKNEIFLLLLLRLRCREFYMSVLQRFSHTSPF